MTNRVLRCAVYTRKSTEEGLEQAFNSLDAQRESCEAYIRSQAGEGWSLLPAAYDDGGFSGGTMERPALRRLLADIDRGRVDIVVVYKIDRLTRSLADFAKIVEQFDKREVCFVSVTQAFNTTTSMGRLTLNVLLSFAQFEREVTAERIRDKVAASRAKGIFMGGCPPLGYDARERKLIANDVEAESVRFIFSRYLELGSVAQLRAELDAKGITTKAWVSTRGKSIGGNGWYVGPLQHLLRNRVYIGEAVHKGASYRGEHEPIVSRDLFDAVQAKLDSNRVNHKHKRTVGSRGLLTGLIFDNRGNALSPKRSRKPDGRTYLYYVSQASIQRREHKEIACRPIAAPVIEGLVHDRIHRLLAAPSASKRQCVESSSVDDDVETAASGMGDILRRYLKRIEVSPDRVILMFDEQALITTYGATVTEIEDVVRPKFPPEDQIARLADRIGLTVFTHLTSRGGSRCIEGNGSTNLTWTVMKSRLDPCLIKALAHANHWRQLLDAGEVSCIEELAKLGDFERSHARRILRLAFLAPDIQQAILAGRQPVTMTLTALTETEFPLLWAEQRRALGLAASTV